LAYCRRSQPYLAHQITAPHIAGARGIAPAKECDLANWLTKNNAANSENTIKKLDRASQEKGMKKRDRTVSNLISPAPIPQRRRIGEKIRTVAKVIGFT